ncbi:MAG: HXXEE domain-containing protein [bacterium]
METVPLSASVILIALAAVHILEEAVKGFRSFFNTVWFNGNKNCPVGRIKGVLVDKIGLFLLLAALALTGAWVDGRWILIAVGILTADLLQHALFSISKKNYTPGVATSFLYLVYVVYFFSLDELQIPVDDLWAGIAMAVGAAFIGANYLAARRKVRLGRCQEAGA